MECRTTWEKQAFVEKTSWIQSERKVSRKLHFLLHLFSSSLAHFVIITNYFHDNDDHFGDF